MTLIIGGGIVITLPILLFQFVGSDPAIAATVVTAKKVAGAVRAVLDDPNVDSMMVIFVPPLMIETRDVAQAIGEAAHYGLYDLDRVETMTLRNIRYSIMKTAPAAAPTRPRAMPTPVRIIPWVTTDRRTELPGAPRAIRTPISRVRSMTERLCEPLEVEEGRDHFAEPQGLAAA